MWQPNPQETLVSACLMSEDVDLLHILHMLCMFGHILEMEGASLIAGEEFEALEAAVLDSICGVRGTGAGEPGQSGLPEAARRLDL